MDVNGDGRDDLVFLIGFDIDPDAAHHLPIPERFSIGLLVALSQGNGQFTWVGAPIWQGTTWEDEPDNASLDQPQDHLREIQCQSGDVNGDGKSDLVCSFQRGPRDQSLHFLGTALSRGDGTFDISETLAPFSVGGFNRRLAVGDLDGDGRAGALLLDVCECPPDTPKSALHYNLVTARRQGTGAYTFTRQPTDWTILYGTVFPDAVPQGVVAVDLNGDGKADYLTWSNDEFGMETATSTPAGGFELHKQPLPLELIASALEGDSWMYGDANGDGKTDILVMSRVKPHPATDCSKAFTYDHALLTRVLGNGDGTFQLPTTWGDCHDPQVELDFDWSNRLRFVQTRAADTNGDGLAGFLVAFTRNGKTIIHDDVSTNQGLDTVRWIPADVNGDGVQDLVYVYAAGTTTRIYTLLRQAGGSYVQQPPQEFPKQPHQEVARNWKVMDVDGDGKADLVYIRTDRTDVWVDTYFYQGDGAWLEEPRKTVAVGTLPNTLRWWPMDVDGDGKEDLVYVERAGNAVQVQTLLSRFGSGGTGDWVPRQDGRWDLPGVSGTLNLQPADINGDGKADLVHMTFLNPGVWVDALLSNGDGTWHPPHATDREAWPDAANGAALFDTQHWKVLDVNGDGKTDLVRLAYDSKTEPDGHQSHSIKVHTLLSNGNGSWTPKIDYQLPDFKASDTLNWKPADVNGDGRADLVHVASLHPGVQVDTLLSKGDGSWTAKRPQPDAWQTLAVADGIFWKAADVDGDGKTDLIRVDYEQQEHQQPALRTASLLSLAPLDLVTTVANGTGGTIAVDYRPSSGFTTNDTTRGCHLPGGAIVQVVSAVLVNDGRTPLASTQSYSYACARWSARERGFLGWQVVTATRGAGANRPASNTTTQYLATDECLIQPLETQVTDEAGNVFTRVLSAYVPRAGPAPHTCQVSSLERMTSNQTATTQDVFTEYAYDNFGNVTDIFEYGDRHAPGDERTTSISYNPAKAPYIVGLPWQVTISEGVQPATRIYRLTYYCYDGDNGSESANCSGKPVKGLLTATQAVDDQGLYITTTYQHDGYGNVWNQVDARHNGKTIFYDPIYHLYPETTCNALGQCTTLKWDPVVGNLQDITDANGHTHYDYDQLGRLKSTTYPNSSTQMRDYLDWGDPGKQRVRDRLDDGSADGLWTDTYVDGLGRTYRVVKKGDVPDTTFVQETLYGDSSSEPWKQSHWYKTGPAVPVYETFEYDGAGRPLKQIHPDNTSLQWVYGNDESRTSMVAYDELNHEKATFQDAYGRPQQVRESNAGQYAYPTYTYNSVDELLTVTDAVGNITTNRWDVLGRRRWMSDPDTGTHSYDYDSVGNLKTQTDGNTVTLTFTYDSLNRLSTKQYPDGEQVVWHYDEPGHGASLGRLTSITEPVNQFGAGIGAGCTAYPAEDLSYDAMGNVTSESKCVDDTRYTMGFLPDKLGRPTKITYPDGEEVNYTYDTGGRLDYMSGYVDRLQYDAAGRPTRVQYHNRRFETFVYDPNREWLKDATVASTVGNAPPIFQAHYEFYGNGLIQSSSSTTHDMNLTFTYDDLDRVTHVAGDWDQSFLYDMLGNMTYNSKVGTYTYPQSGASGCTKDVVQFPCPGPHAVQTGPASYHYDPNGNMISVLDSASPQARPIYWNYDNRLSTTWDANGVATQNRYDAAGERVVRGRGSETRYYYGRFLESSSAKGLTKYYYAGQTLVARSDSTGQYWYHQDHLGSTRVMTNSQGTVVARYDYAPFGATTHSSGSVPNDKQFAGKQIDEENGLIYMGARYYDPNLARFISADTTMPDGLNPQALNRYSYVFNNPALYTDPSGHEPERSWHFEDETIVGKPWDPSEWAPWPVPFSPPPLIGATQAPRVQSTESNPGDIFVWFSKELGTLKTESPKFGVGVGGEYIGVAGMSASQGPYAGSILAGVGELTFPGVGKKGAYAAVWGGFEHITGEEAANIIGVEGGVGPAVAGAYEQSDPNTGKKGERGVFFGVKLGPFGVGIGFDHIGMLKMFGELIAGPFTPDFNPYTSPLCPGCPLLPAASGTAK